MQTQGSLLRAENILKIQGKVLRMTNVGWITNKQFFKRALIRITFMQITLKT